VGIVVAARLCSITEEIGFDCSCIADSRADIVREILICFAGESLIAVMLRVAGPPRLHFAARRCWDNWVNVVGTIVTMH